MNIKVKISGIILISALISVLTIGCSAANTTKTGDKDALTIDKIKVNYKTQTIKSINQFGGHYALVDAADSDGKDSFELYNLKTGDQDILPTLPNKVSLDKIVNENEIDFLASGEDYESSNVAFPFEIRCIRNGENTKSNSDFYALNESLYLKTDKNVTLGRDVKSVLSDVNLSFDGFEVLFGPASKDDVGYFSDVTSIPLTNTQFVEDKNQLVINFANTAFDKEILKQKVLSNNSNLYFKSIELKQNGTDAQVIINLKDTGVTYNIEVNRLKNNLPFARVSFK